MLFERWLAECRAIICRTLSYSDDKATLMIEGAGLSIYRAKFDRGLTPQQCVDDELIYFSK